jgi:hypothetical protein
MTPWSLICNGEDDMATVPNLDKRIATALTETDHDAADLAALIKETTDIIGSITAEIAHASKEMLDPQNHDYIASREHVGRAELMVTRYNASMPKLQALHRQAVARDQLAAWNADLAKLVAVRNEVSARFRERYCTIGDELVSLFDEVQATDQLIEALHVRAPPSTPRMRTTEAHARGVERIGGTTKSILEEIRLPSFGLEVARCRQRGRDQRSLGIWN